MAKSRAEIQRAYRQRQKDKNNEQYLEKERRRRRATYIPNSQLSKVEKDKRNQKNREYLKLYRKKKTEAAVVQNNVVEENEVSGTSGYESSASTPAVVREGPGRLVVQMRFASRARGARVRMQNAVRESKKEAKTWKTKYEKLRMKYKTSLRKLQRSRKQDTSQMTPRSKTNRQMKNLSLNQRQKNDVRKSLLFNNVLCEEIASARESCQTSKRSVLHNIVGGKLLKRYRCASMINIRTGLSRNKLGLTAEKKFDTEKNSTSP